MKIDYLYNTKNKTHIGIGPMSKNCVDAVIELAYEYDINLMLIASRRQIESLELGSGYVNNWDTISFSRYVKENDPKNKILLARDHGGPWQHPLELKTCKKIEDAMESAKQSFKVDIESGFNIIHIDPIFNNSSDHPTIDWVLDKVFELYAYCYNVAKMCGKSISIEIGTEEQNEYPVESPSIVEELLGKIIDFCEKNNYPKPIYVVVQTGTKVMGKQNIGDFPSVHNEIRNYVDRHKIDEVIKICEKYGIMMKEHNADYLSDESLSIHPELGFHAINVAPEFGVVETSKLIEIINEIGLKEELKKFIDICLNSNKWKKWIIGLTNVSDLEKAILSGHYVFANHEFINLKNEIAKKYFNLTKKNLDVELKKSVKLSILRYLEKLNLLKETL